MKLTFMGQQSWAVESGRLFVLIDPVLPDWFGTTDRQRFEIWPPRRIAMDRMPYVSAVVITNEHLDHFNLRSLLLLPKSTPIYVGTLTPSSCIEAVRRAGMTVHLLEDREKLVLEDLVISLYLCGPESAPWEKRVYHAVVCETSSNQSVIIQSDGLISPDLVGDITSGDIAPVSFFVATNNAQVVPPNASGTYDNLLPIGEPSNEGPFGIRVFNEVLCRSTQDLGYVPYLAFCGGGYLQSPPKHGPFLLTDASGLQRCLDTLGLEQKVYCPTPGDSYVLYKLEERIEVRQTKAEWVEPKQCTVAPPPQRGDWFDQGIFDDLAVNEARDAARHLIAQELSTMAPALLFSEVGRLITASNAYINGPTGSHRFAIRFYEGASRHVMTAALDINRCRFDWLSTSDDQVIHTIPFGIDVYLADFHELLQGGLQIWELATARMRQWYLGTDKLRSPISFLYGYFSEQVRPEIAAKMYARIALER